VTGTLEATRTSRARQAGRKLRRHARALLLLVLLLLGGTLAIRANAGPVIPVPNPLVKVRTQSGPVVRERVIPLGGAPVPLDVDERKLLGLLWPDVDVSVGMVAAEELPGAPIVPTIEVNRDPTALLRNAPAPPLKIDFTIELKDAGNGLSDLATIKYGYETPPGALIPSRFKSKLVGPIQGGFIDPLEAIVETPGYSAPLKVNANVTTPSFIGDFQVGLNPLPERIHFVEDPRDDGLDFSYDHEGPIPDIKLDARGDLTDRDSGRVRHVDASVERLPQFISLSNTNTDDRTFVEYRSESPLGKPDIEANYRDTAGGGKVVVDGNVKIAGLPSEISGEVGYSPDSDGGSEIESALFEVGEGQEIDAIDFVFRNWTGDPGPVPEPALGPDQFLAAATRQMPDESQRFRIAGRLQGLRSATFNRVDGGDGLDLTTDVGDGVRPLKALFDLDDRGPGGPEDSKRIKVDTTITPLPREIHTLFDPASGTDPTNLLYEANQSTDIDATALLAEGSQDGCGQAEVTCLGARIDKLPPLLDIKLPGEDGTDFSLHHTGTGPTRPDVRAQVDTTPEDVNDRTFADVRILRVPTEVRGRLDISNEGVVKAAEFHGCPFDFAADKCPDGTQQALGRVDFTVRNSPERPAILPPRPDTTPEFVSLLSRDPDPDADGDDKFEVTGRVDEVRNVAFHQRDANDDGEADGTLGALVDAGSGNDFDVVVDDLKRSEGDPKAERTGVTVNVFDLPALFSACVRESKDEAPPDPSSLPADSLLRDCDSTETEPDEGEPAVTPLTAVYKASANTKVRARVTSEGPDSEDGDRQHTDDLDVTVDKVPESLRTDVIPPESPDADTPGRKLQLVYDASSAIGKIDFDFQTRRSNSLCEDPRPNREATCLSGRLVNLPDDVTAVYDPDESKGDIQLVASPPGSGQQPLSVGEPLLPLDHPDQRALHVSSVSPNADDPTDPREADRLVLDAKVKGIAGELVGKFQKINLEPEATGETGSLAHRISTCSNDADDDAKDGKDGVDPDCAPDMARVELDACPDGDEGCIGIEEVELRAQNSLVGDPLEDIVPPTVSDATQEFSFVERGEGALKEFRALAHVKEFKELVFSKIDKDEQPSETTRLRTAFGSGAASEKIHAYIDRDSGRESQLIDGVIGEAPQAVNICLRDEVDPADVKTDGSFTFCDRAPAKKLAIQARLDVAAGDNKPDISIRQFKLSKGGGAEVLTGPPSGEALGIDNLAERIDVLAGKDDTDIQVEGHGINDAETADPIEAAGRVRFDLRNFVGTGGTSFPFRPLDPAGVEVDQDPDNTDGDTKNFLKVMKSPDALRLHGSVPAIKRVIFRPGACDPSDPRYPALDPDTWGQANLPEYTCVNVLATEGRPLGLAIRTEDENGKVLSLDEGRLSSIPGGKRSDIPLSGFSATLAKHPERIDFEEICGESGFAVPCRPPMLSVSAPKNQSSTFEGRLAVGDDEATLDDLREVAPVDPRSALLDYEQRPRNYAGNGARVKIETSGGDEDDPDAEPKKGLRVGLKIALPNFLDLDPPTSFSCNRMAGETGCVDDGTDGFGADHNNGTTTKDIFFKLVGANGQRLGSDVGSLGRVALLVNGGDGQTIVTGAPAPDNKDPLDNWEIPSQIEGDPPFPIPTSPVIPGGTSANPNDALPSGPQTHDRGFDLPGHLEARIYMRDNFNAPEGKKQHSYVQVDGRVNVPLSMALRVNKFDPETGAIVGFNRSHDPVSSQQFTVRNAPGLQPGGPTDYAQPTFRVRAETRSPRKDPNEEPSSERKCLEVLEDLIGLIPKDDDVIAEFISTIADVELCLILPNPDVGWLDVNMNADPDGAGGTPPARTVEAVVDKGSINADLVGYRDIFRTDVSKGTLPRAQFTPQAGAFLEPFNLGVGLGVKVLSIDGVGSLASGNVDLRMNGNVTVHAAGMANQRLRLSNDKAGIQLKSEGGPSRVSSQYVTAPVLRIHGEILGGFFGLLDFDESFPLGVMAPNPLVFAGEAGLGNCTAGTSLNSLDVSSGSDEMKSIFIAPGAGTIFPTDPAVRLLFSALSTLASPVFCFDFASDTSSSQLVASNAPAPSFTDPDRPVPDAGQAGTPNAPTPGTPPPAPSPPPNIDITGTDERCGVINASTLRVPTGAKLVAKPQGSTYNRPVKLPDGSTSTFPIPCDGSLSIKARQVIVESGGEISANGRRLTGGPGTPGGTGGGAGHAGVGGASGSGSGGGGTYGADTPPAADFGSRGAAGTGVSGGNGGGTLNIQADDSMTINGTVSANGNPGVAAGGSCDTGGGGGSGGHVQLSSPRITIGGSVAANGGRGGDGGDSGGGGGGGRVTMNVVSKQGAGVPTANGGGTGTAGSGCTAGGAGGNGNASLGVRPGRGASVTRIGTSEFVRGQVLLNVKALDPSGGKLRVLVCRNSLPPGTTDPFTNPALKPSGSTPAQVINNSEGCISEFFSAPTSGGDTYERTITLDLPDGYHGLFSLAAKPPSDTNDCTSGFDTSFSSSSTRERSTRESEVSTRVADDPNQPPDDPTDPPDPPDPPEGCDFQDVMPTAAEELLASDATPPSVQTQVLNGEADCPTTGVFCIRTTIGRLRVSATDAVSGPASGVCDVGSGNFDRPCGPAPVVQLQLGEGDGLRNVRVKVKDKAGNETAAIPAGNWFIDSRPPSVPTIRLEQQGTQVNSWYRQKPQLRVSTIEPPITVGYGDDPISLFVDEAEHKCGAVDGRTAACETDDPGDFAETIPGNVIPTEGIHFFTAKAQDRLGNESARSSGDCEGTTEAGKCAMKVDLTAPKSRLFLGPKAPDGKNGFYISRPFFAFAASDKAGGSGVDLSQPGGVSNGVEFNKIKYQIDGGAFQDWNPNDDLGNRIPEGIHSICWYAIDLAGNKEDGGNPNSTPTTGNPANCKTAIKVDQTDPTASLTVTPAAPDGNNSFYVNKPDVTQSGTDPVPSGVPAADTSGLDRVEYQIDGGAWQPAAPFQVSEGEHEIRVRAFDKAGNPAVVQERVVRVDLSKPTGRFGTYPPRPNDQGWFRQSRIHSIALTDGRDSSGIDGATYSVDGGAPIAYLGPFGVGNGLHSATAQARDRAGLLSTPFSVSSQIDLQPPVPAIATPDPTPILLPGNTTTLRFSANGTNATTTPRVKLIVWIYNELGILVHRINVPGPHPGGYSDAGPGSVSWDGKDSRGRAVLPGLYHYRVEAIDQAGNSAITTESANFLVLLPGSPV
jgi:hypothetical protein